LLEFRGSIPGQGKFLSLLMLIKNLFFITSRPICFDRPVKAQNRLPSGPSVLQIILCHPM